MQVSRGLVVSLLLLLASSALAAHFTGSYQDPQGGVGMVIQQGTDGRMQGTFSGPNGQFAFQGQGNEQGAYGAMTTPQGPLGFQAQFGPDGQTLHLTLYQMDQNGRPAATGQQLVLRRVGAGAPPAMPAAPGGPPPTGAPVPPTGGPVPPGGAPLPPGQPGAPGAFPPAPGGAPFPPAGGAGWNGRFVGDAGRMVMVVQGQQAGYAGHFEANGQRYPFRAQGDETHLEGSFEANGASYDFYAERTEGGGVYLYTGDAEYVLQPAGAAPSPGAPSGNPLGD